MVLGPKDTTSRSQPPAIPNHHRNAMNDFDDLDIELGIYTCPSTVGAPPAFTSSETMAHPQEAKPKDFNSQLPAHNTPLQFHPPQAPRMPPSAAPISDFSRRQQVLPKAIRKCGRKVCLIGGLIVTVATVLIVVALAFTPGISLNKVAANAVHEVEWLMPGW